MKRQETIEAGTPESEAPARPRKLHPRIQLAHDLARAQRDRERLEVRHQAATDKFKELALELQNARKLEASLLERLTSTATPGAAAEDES